jgi:hypothetical protein
VHDVEKLLTTTSMDVIVSCLCLVSRELVKGTTAVWMGRWLRYAGLAGNEVDTEILSRRERES